MTTVWTGDGGVWHGKMLKRLEEYYSRAWALLPGKDYKSILNGVKLYRERFLNK